MSCKASARRPIRATCQPASRKACAVAPCARAQIRPDNKPVIAQAAATAKARQVSVICLIGHTDKLGDKTYNEKLARSRAQAVAAQMIRDGVPANHLYIVADPEAFGNTSLGKEDASVVDRKVTIFFSR
mgnify:CR=1 FL=1